MASHSGARPPSNPDGLALTVVNPQGQRRTVRVERSPFRIGRLPDCELTLKDGRISRHHAQILLEDGQYVIEDTESRHGVFVNGRKVRRAGLRARDRVDFGVEDSFHLFVGEEPSSGSPLLRKVASMPALEGTGNLSRLSAVIDVARAWESSGSVDDVLAAAVDAALTVTGAERGFLMLKDDEGELEIRIARDSSGQALAAEALTVPRRVIARSLAERRELFAMSFDPGVDTSADPGQTVLALELRSVVCVPLVRIRLGDQAETKMLSAAQDTLGALYMDSREAGANLAEGNQDLLQTLAIEISTVLENARLLDEERKKHLLEQELQIAREIQQALLPARLPTDGWLVAAGSSDACFEVGGDCFDVMELGPDGWGAVLVDVSGKGVSAALLASLLQGAFFSAASSDAGLAESVAHINRYVCERSRNARFATAFCCSIHRDGQVRWTNAGHCAGLWIPKEGPLKRLEPTSHPIGLFADAEFPEESFQMSPGDRLLLYSDGVSEAEAESKERFGEERIESFLAENRALSVEELHQRLIDEVTVFTQGARQGDDLTLVVLGFEG